MTAQADYGLDAPGSVRGLIIRGAVMLVVGVVFYYLLRHARAVLASLSLWFGVCGGGSQLVVAALMVWSSRVGKLRMRDRLVASLRLRGDEQVLDIGCGRGLCLIGVARRLTTGNATGIDLWSENDLSDNHPRATLENAAMEGVAARVRVETGDARALPFADESFDAVISSTALHNIPDREGRRQAVSEALRVLKPGGRLAVFDIFHPWQYYRWLRELGATDLRRSAPILLWGIPGLRISACKAGQGLRVWGRGPQWGPGVKPLERSGVQG